MPEPFSGAGVSIAYSRAHPYLKNKRIEMYEDDLAECPLCRDAEPGRRTTLGRTLASEEGANVQTWAVEMRCGDCNRTYTVDERRTKLAAGSSAPTHRARPWGIPATCSGKGSWSGTTPKGLEWSAFASAFHDSEDNDTSCSLTMGPLKIASSEDCGRTWGEYKASVSHDVFGTVSSRYTRSVSSTHTDPLTYTGSSTVVTRALAEIAEREGLSVDDVLSQLGGFGRIAAGLMKAPASTSEAGKQRTVDATQSPSVLADGKSEVPAVNEHAESVPPQRAEQDEVPPKQSAKAAGAALPAQAQAQASWGIPGKFRYVSSPGNYQADTHTVSGKTPRGLEWTASASHCQDLEDNDRSWSLQLGNMRVAQSNDCGRDWASASTSVSHPTHGTISCADGRCRDPSQNEREKVTGSRSVAQLAINEIAEHEGVSVDQVVAQLGYFSGIVRRFL